VPNGEIFTTNIEKANQASGVASAQIRLLDSAGANTPGIWVPWSPFHKGSLDISSVGSMVGTVSLMASNAPQMPYNSFRLTVGGSATEDDVITVNINCGALTGGVITTTYTVGSGEDLDSITENLALAIRAAIQVALNNSNTINFNVTPSMLVVEYDDTGHTININWNHIDTPLDVVRTLSGGASVTVSVAAYDYGVGSAIPGCVATATGIIPFDCPATWLRAKVAGWSSGDITAMLQGNIP